MQFALTVPVFGDRTSPAIDDDTPHVHQTLTRQVGTSGTECAGLVTAFDVAAGGYATDGHGQKSLSVAVTWTKPSDVRYGGLVIFMIRGGTTYAMTGVETGTSAVLKIPDFPATNTDVTFYGLSVDVNNRRNTYQFGTTPAHALTLQPPSLGSAGVEYTSLVTGFGASVTYPTMADGTVRAMVSVAFSAPSDKTFGGVEIRAHDGTAYFTWLKTASSPAVFDIPVGVFSQGYAVFAVSYDVNGRLNTIQSGTPRVDISIGNSAGQLDLTKAKATSYDSDIFTISAGEFKVWAMHGSLLVTGTVGSGALDTTAINVGGGGGKPGKFAIYDGSGVQIGHIGVEEATVSWFKSLGIGGASKSAPKFVANSSGVVTLTDGKIVVSGTWGSLSQTLTMDPSATYYPFELVGGDNSIGMSANYALGAEVVVQDSTLSNRDPHASISRYIFPAGDSHAGYGWAWLRAYTGTSTSHPHVNIYARHDPTVSGSYGSSADLEIGINATDRLFLVHAGTDASYVDLHEMVLKVGGMEVISAARVANFASLKIGGTEVLNSSRVADVVSLKVGGTQRVDSSGNGAFPNYYTKSEIDSLLAGYAASGHTHTGYAASDHSHTVNTDGAHDHGGQVSQDYGHSHSLS